jgi:hypothetical protein
VRAVDLLELRLGVLPGVAIRVVLRRELSERLADGVLVGRLLHTEGLVQVAGHGLART